MPNPDSNDSDAWPARPAVALTLLGFGFYFGLWMLPKWWPGIGGFAPYLLYLFSIPLILLMLLAIGIWGASGSLGFRRNRRPATSRDKTLLTISLIGLGVFATTLILLRAIPASLPTGSHLLDFDSVAWKSPGSEEFVRGDFTRRQKMLGSLLERLEPGISRSEIEELLGTSLDTQYFSRTERDLIYILGPERDRAIALDSEWLLIWLDDSGNLERREIRRD